MRACLVLAIAILASAGALEAQARIQATATVIRPARLDSVAMALVPAPAAGRAQGGTRQMAYATGSVIRAEPADSTRTIRVTVYFAAN